jgi:hypothetical protein
MASPAAAARHPGNSVGKSVATAARFPKRINKPCDFIVQEGGIIFTLYFGRSCLFFLHE